MFKEAEAREIATLLNVGADVAELPGGFDTLLTGTSSDIIAPGLKQRIAAVRVLTARPRILLFDQADRSLDRQGYDAFFRLLAKIRANISLVLVSDDENIRKLATRRIMIEKGRVTLDQRKSDALNADPTYRSVA